MSVCLGVHAPASNLEAGSELPTCIASPNTQTCLLTVTKDCISPEQSAVRLLVLLSVPKPHYASKQSGAQLHPPHGRGATVPKKQRPCPRSSGRSCGELREETPTTEDNETETVTLLIHAHTPNESLYRGKETWADLRNKSWTKRARDRPHKSQIICEGGSQKKRAHRTTPHFYFSLHPSGGGCMSRPRISRRGASFQHALQAQILIPACLP